MDLCRVMRALGDPTRYQIVSLLRQHQPCSQSLARSLGISEAAVSQHMAVLKECGLVRGWRCQRKVHYALVPQTLQQAIAQMGDWLEGAIACLPADEGRPGAEDAAAGLSVNEGTSGSLGTQNIISARKDDIIMKVAVPSETDLGLASVRSGHFGHSPYFTIATIEDGKIVSVEAVKNADHDAVGCFGVIEYVAGLGIDAIVTAGMGRPPFMHFSQLGVQVYLENETPNVGDVLQKFIAGGCMYMALEDACNHHH